MISEILNLEIGVNRSKELSCTDFNGSINNLHAMYLFIMPIGCVVEANAHELRFNFTGFVPRNHFSFPAFVYLSFTGTGPSTSVTVCNKLKLALK